MSSQRNEVADACINRLLVDNNRRQNVKVNLEIEDES